ncbi:MAG: sialidase family protein [Bacteroidales bacterium]|nr:sialidase family protein [Bacteroidales bacterium]
MSNACTEASVYYLISNGDGTWKIKNYYTNHFWGVPVYNQALASVVEETSAGVWSLNFSNGIAYPSAPDAENTVRGLDRSSSKLYGYTTGTGVTKQVKIYEVSADEINLTFDKPGSATNNVTVNVKDASGNIVPGVTATLVSTSCTEFKTGTAAALSRTTNSVLAPNAGYDNQQNSAITYTIKVDGLSTAFSYNSAALDVYALTGGGGAQGNNGSTIREWSFDVSTGSTEGGVSTFVSSTGNDICTVSDADGDLYHKVWELNGTEQNVTAPIYIKVTLTKTASLGCYAGIGAVKLYTHADAITTSDVFTIRHTDRGALTYEPTKSTTYLWSSGKQGATAFDATNPNHQWVICPTGTDGQYYLYNVGAGKFAIPTGIAQSASNSWVFSDNAVAVIFEEQSDGTKKIKMASNPVSGTNAAYMAVSNGYTGPIINYNDAGGNFTITKVTGDASTAANAAVAKLVKNQTALTGAVTANDGWYVISIKTTSNSTATASPGRYIYPGTTNQANYPLTFTGGVDVQPSISDATFFTRFVKNGTDYNWQMTDGQYLANISNVFPKASSVPAAVNPGYDNGNYIYASGRYADPYVSSGNFFIGETATYRTTWNIYPVDLTAAGLVAWQALCNNAPESAQITCSRSDVKGLTSVYKNGFFFLPTNVTPEESDFTLEGASGITIDASAHTVTFAYDPNLAIVADGVIVEQGWQTAGRGGEVMLMKVTAAPFKAATNTALTVSLKDGSESNISALKLYEANSSSPEIYSTGSGAPTKTEVATATISGSTATFNIGNLTAGTHYYWIGATVKSDATLGAVLDAAVTGIAYQVEGQTAQNLDLTSVGDPADRGAMIFNVQSYPFLPRDNGSRVYRIPAMAVADDGSIVVAADKRYDRYDDIGNSHVIDIVVRRSTDGGKTWSAPLVIAKGENTTANGGEDSRCGFGDPSLVKGKDGKLYCLFAAGNEGYFKGQKGMCMSVSTDNGVTWSSGEGNPPVDLYRSGAIKNVTTVGEAGYGLYDYFVTSGRGLYIPEDDILMYLIPAQTMTSATEHTGDSQDYIFYSRDGGESWYFSETPMVQGGDEAKIIQMNDGSLFGSIRKQNPRRFNTATYTKNDDGKTLSFNFGTQWDNSQLSQTHQNNQDIYYYQRETTEGKTDVIIHSITTGNHVNFKLFYSTDKGVNWTEFLNVQTKGTRYVTMDKNPANGSLYLFFEDQSLNSAGGYTDYNHYPLNFIEITRDQLAELIPELDEYQVPDFVGESKEVRVVYGTTGHTAYGTISGNTWTSNASSGVAGFTITKSDGSFNQFSSWNGHFNMAYAPGAANTASTLTLTAPDGYIITGYSLLAAKAYSAAHTYTLTAEDGTTITPSFATSSTGYTELSITGLSAASTTISITSTDASKYIAIADFVVTLANKPLALNVCGDASYATLYLPVDAQTDGNTKAYYITTANNGFAQLIETPNEGTDIPAFTAVVLINDQAEAATPIVKTSGLTSVVSQDDNLLKGTLFAKTLDLSDATPYYSLGKKDDAIGFYKYDNNGTTTITLGANKAYLETPAASYSSKGFVFTFDDPTAIASILSGQSSANGQWYTLDGRKLNGVPTQRGIYINNGKKIVVK